MEGENTYGKEEYDFSTSQRCANCDINPAGKGQNRLCESCRQAFIKYPIPKWIWAFAACVLVVMIFGFARMGNFMKHSISLARAEKAMEDHRYRTAQKELKKVLAQFPDKLEAKADMLIAAAYNHDEITVQEMYDKLANVQFQDAELLDRIDKAFGYYDVGLVDSATGVMIMEADARDSVKGLEQVLSRVDTISDPSLRKGGFLYVANLLFDYKEYDKSQSALEVVLKQQPDNYLAISLSAAIKRNQGHFEEAVALLNRLLAINKEDVSIIAQLSRTELKRSNDKVAADLVKKAMAIDPNDISVLEAKSMVAYFGGKKEESQQTFNKIKRIEATAADSTISTRLNKILSGQEKFR